MTQRPVGFLAVLLLMLPGAPAVIGLDDEVAASKGARSAGCLECSRVVADFTSRC